MVCSICGIQGHNKRRCEQPIKEHYPSVVSNVEKMFVAVDQIQGRSNKIKQCIIMFDYLVFHKWFVLTHEKFRKSIMVKLTEFEKENFPNIDYLRKQFTKKKVKKIKTDECPICYDKLEDINVCTTKCGHSFCMDCMKKVFKKKKSKCPICRVKL
jgi:hypothetical protein